MPLRDYLGDGIPEWFQQDGAAAYLAMKVRDRLTLNFHNWIERHGHVKWSPCPPEHSLLDFSFKGMLKKNVNSVKITD